MDIDKYFEMRWLFAIVIFMGVTASAQDTVKHSYVVLPTVWAQGMRGRVVGDEQFNYAVTIDSTYVTDTNALHFFKTSFDSLWSSGYGKNIVNLGSDSFPVKKMPWQN